MALLRRTGNRFQASIWPGFVDAMTGLLLVLMFVLTIFTVVQFVLRETISGQEDELNTLSSEVLALAQALGIEQGRAIDLEAQVGDLAGQLDTAKTQVTQQAALIASLQTARAEQKYALTAATAQINSFEEQVAALLTQRNLAEGTIADLERKQESLKTEREKILSREAALKAALASSRSEIDAQTEAARLAAMQREALQSMIDDLRRETAAQDAERAELTQKLAASDQALSDEEAARLAEAAAAEVLRNRLLDADAELTAMTLALEKQRQEAEDTLTLLAAADEMKDDLELKLAAAMLAKTDAESSADFLRREIDSSKKDLSATESDLALTVVQLQITQDQLRMNQEQVLAMQTRLDAALLSLGQARGNSDARAAQLSQTEQALAAALLNLETARIEAIVDQQEFERAQVELQDRTAALEREIAIRDDNRLAQEVILASLQQELDQATFELQQGAEVASATQAQMRGQINELEADLSAALGRLEAEQVLLKILKSESSQARSEDAEKLADLAGALAALKAEKSAQAERIVGLNVQAESDRDVASKKIANLQKALANVRAMLEKQQTQAYSLSAQSAEYKRALTQATDTIAALRKALAKSRTALEQAQTALAEDSEGFKKRLSAVLTQQLANQEEIKDVRQQLAAALAAKLAAKQDANARMTEAEKRAVLLSEARKSLFKEKTISEQARREMAVLGQQVAALRNKLQQLQGLLDEATAKDLAEDVQLQSLGRQLNSALARVAQEERKRRMLEEAERQRLKREAEELTDRARDLEKYRSEFFGRLRDVMGQQEDVRIVGDRFVFGSEVLFSSGNASLSQDGRAEVAKVARTLKSVADKIPQEINWVLRVDGHTDNARVLPNSQYEDNWELSSERALSVVRYLANELDIPPNRLAANGFGSHQPLSPDQTEEARAQNRRIELKLTGK